MRLKALAEIYTMHSFAPFKQWEWWIRTLELEQEFEQEFKSSNVFRTPQSCLYIIPEVYDMFQRLHHFW